MDYTQNNRRISREMEPAIVKEFTEGLIPVIALAKKYGITRCGIYKLLNRNGVDTTKAGPNAHPTVYCSFCGADFVVSRLSLRKNRRRFCSMGCWHQYLAMVSIGQNIDRYGMMHARVEALKHFGLKVGQTVHHINGDEKDNRKENLAVFEDNGDHVRYHRGCAYKEPVWNGSGVPLPTVRATINLTNSNDCATR